LGIISAIGIGWGTSSSLSIKEERLITLRAKSSALMNYFAIVISIASLILIIACS